MGAPRRDVADLLGHRGDRLETPLSFSTDHRDDAASAAAAATSSGSSAPPCRRRGRARTSRPSAARRSASVEIAGCFERRDHEPPRRTRAAPSTASGFGLASRSSLITSPVPRSPRSAAHPPRAVLDWARAHPRPRMLLAGFPTRCAPPRSSARGTSSATRVEPGIVEVIGCILDLGVYLHFPWCRKLARTGDFASDRRSGPRRPISCNPCRARRARRSLGRSARIIYLGAALHRMAVPTAIARASPRSGRARRAARDHDRSQSDRLHGGNLFVARRRRQSESRSRQSLEPDSWCRAAAITLRRRARGRGGRARRRFTTSSISSSERRHTLRSRGFDRLPPVRSPSRLRG